MKVLDSWKISAKECSILNSLIPFVVTDPLLWLISHYEQHHKEGVITATDIRIYAARK